MDTLTHYGHIKTAELRQYDDWYTLAVDGWAVTFGTARRGLGGPLLAVSHLTTYPSTASVPIDVAL